jgi:hypothetical protein
MPPFEVLIKVGLVPNILFFGGWLCIGILVLINLYYAFRYVVKKLIEFWNK